MFRTEIAGPVPYLMTTLPGPRVAALVGEDERYTSPSYTRVYPLGVRRASGAVIEDLDGNRFLDFTSGIAVCATGHCHPRVVDAVCKQARSLLHMSGTDFYNEPQMQLARRLCELAPGSDPKRVFFTNSGAEAVEAALKLARYATGRSHLLAFHGGFHGRTMGALSLTGSKVVQRRGFGPLVPGVTHLEYPNVYRHGPHAALRTLEQLEQVVFRRTVAPDEVAAIFVEPVQGEGGYLVPPTDFLPRLRTICDRHGILLVADEIQSGMGRTGKMFAVEHQSVVPDIICLAKGIASGLPLGAIVAKAELMTWPPGAHASTFGGNPVACAAALETIALLEEELLANATTVGNYLQERLRELQRQFTVIGDIRGLGLMVGMELVDHPATKSPNPQLRDDLVQACFQRGLLLLGCGESTIRFCPPLLITTEDVNTAINILSQALTTLCHPASRHAA